MLAAGGGSIVNIGSLASVTAMGRGHIAYSMAMGAVVQMTRELSTEWSGRGVRVNAIGPGSIATDMVKQLMVDDAARKKLLSRTPLGRLGEPSEVASVAVFLASDESSYVTGETIYVDGGRLGLNYTVPVPD